MKMEQFFQRFFSPKQQKASPGGMPAGQSERMKKILAMLSNTRDVELSCDEVFALLDQFTELAVQGEDVAQVMPLLKLHLDMCEDCREEYQALEKIVLNMA